MTRFGWIMTTCFAALVVGASMLLHPAPKLIWNASASVPIGLYAVHPIGTLHVGELVVVRPPEAARDVPRRARLSAHGRAAPEARPRPSRSDRLPHRAARSPSTAWPMGDALDRDRLGRRLPVWQGCRIVADDEVFLMNWQSEYSFDGRYFGPLPASTIVGRADPLWIEKDN